jgi:hypothetical protein
MLSRVALTVGVCAVWSCGGAGVGGTGGGGTGGSDPGPLVDNTQWVPSTGGDEVLGAPPDDAECDTTPMGCPEYPWPDDECVTFDGDSTCVVAYVPECFPPDYTVLAVYTRMRDDRVSLCNWLTLEQPSLRPIRAGDQVEVRTYHSTLTAPAHRDQSDRRQSIPKHDLDGAEGLPRGHFAPVARRQSRHERISSH